MGEIAKYTRCLRMLNNNTQYELANRIGVTTAFVNQIEHGRSKLPICQVEPILDALGITDFKSRRHFFNLALQESAPEIAGILEKYFQPREKPI